MRRTGAARRLAIVGAGVTTAVSLVGCSQIDALAPVSGGPLQTVRVGMLDVLVREDVPIMVAPVCTQEPTQFTCAGSTIDGSPIEAVATLTTPYLITITVGGDVLYDGAVQSVLDEAAQVAP